jgi:putative phosphoserine phosphatase/1-acylglycerol-3-phosphate O-acyltransferase
VSAVDVGAETVGAFFDLDGTLLAAPSLERRFVGYLLERDEITSARVGRWLAGFAESFWRDLHGATEGNKRYLCGIGEELVSDWERSLGAEFFCGPTLAFFDEALQWIVWHRAQGHRVLLVSGTLAPLARVIARGLAAWAATEIEVCATELEIAAGSSRVWNGRIAGEHMSGGAKLRAVAELAARCGIDLSRSYAYGDSVGDLQMLEAVGNAVAVNPTRRLASVARKRGWQTCIWKKTRGEISHVAAQRLAAKAVR